MAKTDTEGQSSRSPSRESREQDALIPKDNASEKTFKRRRMVRTCLMGLFYLTLGLYVGIVGPSIPDLILIQDSTVARLSFALMFKNVGVFAGSVGGAAVSDYRRQDSDLCLFVCSVTAGLMNILLPLSPSLAFLGAFIFIQGVCHGIMNVVCSSAIMTEWRDKSGPPINYIHTLFSMGLLVAPFTTAPFLSPRGIAGAPPGHDDEFVSDESIIVEIGTNRTETFSNGHLSNLPGLTSGDSGSLLVNTTVSSLMVNRNLSIASFDDSRGIANISLAEQEDSRVFIPFAFHGALGIIAGFIFLGFYFGKWAYKKPEKDTPKAGSKDEALWIYQPFIIGVYLAVFLLYVASFNRDNPLLLFGFYIAVDSLSMSKARAATYATIFNAAWVVGRIQGIVLAKYLRIHWLIFVGTAVALVNNILLYVFALDAEAFFWTFTCLIGVFCGPFYPSAMAWINEYTPVNGALVAVVDIGLGVGGFTAVSVGGYILHTFGAQYILLQPLLGCIIIALVIVPLQIAFYYKGNRFKKEKNLQDDLELEERTSSSKDSENERSSGD